MRKLKLQVQMTINGFICGANGEMDWVNSNWDNQLKNLVRDITDPVDTIVLGRILAEGFIPYWKDVANNPKHAEQAAGLKFHETPKVVFSKTLISIDWENTVLENGDLVEEITKLKNQSGGDIIAYGGSNFVSNLISNGLVDEYNLFINPTAIANGKTIFSSIDQKLGLELVEAIPFDCGIIVQCYKPITTSK